MHYAVEMPLSINERRWAENKRQRQSGLSLKQSGPVKTKPAPAQDVSKVVTSTRYRGRKRAVAASDCEWSQGTSKTKRDKGKKGKNPTVSYQLVFVTVCNISFPLQRYARCKTCPACLAEDCGKCSSCIMWRDYKVNNYNNNNNNNNTRNN